jgi:Cys-rich four helix bundle protein (predicted Tat secretion target)
MNRREMLMATGAFVLTSGAALAAETGSHHGAVGGLADCLSTGEACLAHCLDRLATGDPSLAACGKAVNDMLATNAALLRLSSAKSPRAAAMAKVAIDVSRDCEAECRKHAEKHAICKACGEACTRMIKEASALG